MDFYVMIYFKSKINEDLLKLWCPAPMMFMFHKLM